MFSSFDHAENNEGVHFYWYHQQIQPRFHGILVEQNFSSVRLINLVLTRYLPGIKWEFSHASFKDLNFSYGWTLLAFSDIRNRVSSLALVTVNIPNSTEQRQIISVTNLAKVKSNLKFLSCHRAGNNCAAESTATKTTSNRGKIINFTCLFWI